MLSSNNARRIGQKSQWIRNGYLPFLRVVPYNYNYMVELMFRQKNTDGPIEAIAETHHVYPPS